MENGEDSAKIEVRPSSREGLGIFAKAPFERGDYLHTVEYEREVTDAAPLDPQLGERLEHCSYPNGKVMLVAFPGRHMNHSCDPNAYYHFEGTVAQARARRTIAVGEEISVDYLINNPGGDSWPCMCGATRCRGKTGTSFFNLPIEFQIEYFPLLAPWFKAQFPEETSKLQELT